MKKKQGRPGKSPDNPASERQFRQALIKRAKRLGCDRDLIQIFNKYDNALKKCTNEVERKHIAATGAAEVHMLFDCVGGLVVDGKLVVPPEQNYNILGEKVKK